MLPPLLHLIATRPQLLADHAEAYLDLMGEELGRVSNNWKRRALLNAVALCSLGVAAVLGGVALMLWAVTPVADLHAPWALIAAPLLPLATALVCLLTATGQDDERAAFSTLRQQVQADMLMLREVGGP